MAKATDENGDPVFFRKDGEGVSEGRARFLRAKTRGAVKSANNKKAKALSNLRAALARCEELGVDASEVMPTSNGTKQGSLKAAVRSLLTEDKSFLIGQQLLQGALDPSNPRQLDFISRLKEWVDGLETQKSERTEVQQRVVLNLGGTAPHAAPRDQRTLPNVVPPVGVLPPPDIPQKMLFLGGACQEGKMQEVPKALPVRDLGAEKI
jgi:hypothetical protein